MTFPYRGDSSTSHMNVEPKEHYEYGKLKRKYGHTVLQISIYSSSDVPSQRKCYKKRPLQCFSCLLNQGIKHLRILCILLCLMLLEPANFK